MKLILAILASSILHIGMMFTLPLYKEMSTKTDDRTTAQLRLDVSLAPAKAIKKSNLLQASTIKKHKELNKSLDLTDKNKNQAMPSATVADNTKEYAEYLPPNQVEMLALPIKNIDATMLAGAENQNLANQIIQICLRLYIDEFGHVTHIMQINHQASLNLSNTAATDQLTELLYQLPFTPAKRKHLNVKSYQDIAYQFESNS